MRGTKCSGYNAFLGYQIPSEISKSINVRINNDGEYPEGTILCSQGKVETLLSSFARSTATGESIK